MNTLTLWLLVLSGVGGSASPSIPVQFADKAACEAVASRIYNITKERSGPTLLAFCVEAKGVFK